MPDHRKDEESGIREDSVDIVAGSDSPSFASCPTCPGPNRTPTLHAECTPVDSTQTGKGVDGEVDAGVIDNKVDAASSSSPSSETAQEQDKLSLASCSKQHDQKQHEQCMALHALSLEESEKERPIVIRGVVNDVPAQVNAPRLVVTSSSNPGLFAVLKGKRKAEDTKDGPVSSAKTIRKAALGEAEKASNAFWKDREQEIYGDPQGSSGLGSCMQILLSSWDAADPTGIQLMDIEPEKASTLIVPPFAPIHLAGFSITSPGGRITPYMDERHISDPDRVGLERLNILLRANGEELTYMDQQL